MNLASVPLLLGAVLAVAIGFVDAETRQHLGIGFDLGLIAGGLAALGVHAGSITIAAVRAPKP